MNTKNAEQTYGLTGTSEDHYIEKFVSRDL